MRLAFTILRYFPHGGAQRDMLSIAEACHRRGHQVTLFCLEFTGQRPDWLEVCVVPVRGFSNHGRALDFQRQALSAIGAGEFVGIVGFNRMAGLDVYFAADDCLARTLAARSAFYRLLPRARTFAALEGKVFSGAGAKAIMTLTSQQEQDFQRFYGVSSQRLHRLPPVLPPAFQQYEQLLARRAALRAELAATSNDLVAVQVASSYATKGVDRTLRAVASLAGAPSIHVWVIGAEKRPQAMQRLAEKLGLQEKVRFLGGRNDVPSLLAAADLMVHPARKESAGAVLIEGLAAGLPIVCTAACGYAEHVGAAQAGAVLPEPFAQQTLNQALATIVAETEKRRQMRDLARQYVLNNNFYQSAEQGADIIEEALAQS